MYATRGGLGFLPLLIGAAASVGGSALSSSGASKAAKEQAKALEKQVELEAIQAKRELLAAQAAGYAGSAQTERGNVIKWALLGTGGVLLAGAGILWVLSRRKANPRRRRRR